MSGFRGLVVLGWGGPPFQSSDVDPYLRSPDADPSLYVSRPYFSPSVSLHIVPC
ncbi:hypothetical protein ACRALDRAFT_1061483 [Sodiomyces alcalophilus JCM 7366]|uniref:uncharacterized protein n=1 Tax=Sodiomyces alcalophilus JCM 7366 TaxID=591952 RepID=UPI0039B4669C